MIPNVIFFSKSQFYIWGQKKYKTSSHKGRKQKRIFVEKKKKRNTHIPKTQVSKTLSSLIGVTMKSSLYKFSRKESYLTLCDPMNCSRPSLPVYHHVPESNQSHVHRVDDAIQPFLYRPLLLQPSIFPSVRVFPMSQLFASGGQSIGVSASTSVLPMNTQD